MDAARWLGPAPGPVATKRTGPEDPQPQPRIIGTAIAPPEQRAPSARTPVRVATGSIEEADGAVRLAQSFVLEHPREAVWALMSDPEAVALCMPGARLDGPPQDGRVAGRIEVKLGPVAARFAGEGAVTAHPHEYRQVIAGRGADRRGGSRVTGSVEYRLTACPGAAGGEATRVDVAIAYALTGVLAQLGRSALARDLAGRLGEAFARNIDARLSRTPGAAAPQVELGALSLVLAAVRARLRAFLARMLGRRVQ
jgi:carbon-monoxide dehydrogenase small subunit